MQLPVRKLLGHRGEMGGSVGGQGPTSQTVSSGRLSSKETAQPLPLVQPQAGVLVFLPLFYIPSPKVFFPHGIHMGHSPK